MDQKYNIDEILDMSDKKFKQVWKKLDINDVRQVEKNVEYEINNEYIDTENLSKPAKANMVKYLYIKEWLRPNGCFQALIPTICYRFDMYKKLYSIKDLPIKYANICAGYEDRIAPAAKIDPSKHPYYDAQSKKYAKRIVRSKQLIFLPDFAIKHNDKNISAILKSIKYAKGAIFKVDSIDEAYSFANMMIAINYCGCFELSTIDEIKYDAKLSLLTLKFDAESG